MQNDMQITAGDLAGIVAEHPDQSNRSIMKNPAVASEFRGISREYIAVESDVHKPQMQRQS